VKCLASLRKDSIIENVLFRKEVKEMKKIWIRFVGVLALFTMLMPISVMAEEEKSEDIQSSPTSIQEACAEEEIAFEHDYKNNQKNKVNVYMFRGNGCSHCHEFLEYLSSIIDNYGKYINVVTYEVWENQDNAALMEKVAEKFEEEASGVPYIVIGEKTFSGYSSSMNEEIQNLIKEEYKKEDRYDVMKELGVDITVSNDNVENKANKTSSSDLIISIVSIVIIGGAIAFVVIARKQN